ncbi:MAG: extracellular solute-binding protein [bacterium]|nr:extracellular solute-binding protein [bacterium]
MALLVAACRGPAEPLTIVVWDGPRWPNPLPGQPGHDPRWTPGDRFSWLKGVLAEFQALHPGVQVQLVEMNWPDLAGALQRATDPADLPDLAPLDTGLGDGVPLTWWGRGLLEAVDRFLEDQTDFYPAALDAVRIGRRLVGFPVHLDLPVMLLNRELFAERGVPLPQNGRWTWEEFVEAARKLTFDRDGDGATDVWGFAVPALRGCPELWPFLYLDGARPLSPDLSRYTLYPTAVEALTRLVELVAEGTAHPDTGTTATGRLFRDFALGDRQAIAIQPFSTWAILTCQGGDPFGVDLEVAEYPLGSTGLPVTLGRVTAFAVLAQDRGQGLAMAARRRRVTMELGNFLASAHQQHLLAVAHSALPARPSVAGLAPFAGNPALGRALEMAAWAQATPAHPEWPRIDTAVQVELGLALRGEKTPAEALRDAGQKVRAILEEAGR